VFFIYNPFTGKIEKTIINFEPSNATPLLNMVRFLFISIILILLVQQSCIPPVEEIYTDVKMDLKDPAMQKILNFQNEAQQDSLLEFFRHQNPSYRYYAVMAFASLKDSTYIGELVAMLKDEHLDVRAAAAYSIGQTGSKNIVQNLVEAFVPQDTIDVNNDFNANILEAVGKTGNVEHLNQISTVTKYRPRDRKLVLGQVRAIYRFGLRGIFSPDGTERIVKIVTEEDYPLESRIIAASYLMRFSDLNLSDHTIKLGEVLMRDRNPFIRMSLALGIGRTGSVEAEQIILNTLVIEKDWRVRCNLIRALGSFPYLGIRDRVLNLVSDKNIHVAKTAVEYIYNHGNREDIYLYRQYVTDDLHWEIKTAMYAAIVKNTPIFYTRSKNEIKDWLVSEYKSTQEPYHKVAIFHALGEDPYQYKTIQELVASTKNPIEITAACQALEKILKNVDFFRIFGYNGRYVKLEIVEILKGIAALKQAGSLAVIGNIFADKDLDFKALVTDYDFLKIAMEELKLPRDVESYNELGEAIAYMDEVKFIRYKPEPNYLIDWDILTTLTDTSIILVKTTKGNFSIQPRPDLAPVSVANFLNQIKNEYFTDKSFHRVVPNFVVQGGCPIGDGYGSLDHTIRSELSHAYYDDEGWVGMASAGAHTESIQFFVTHSPTPHLDGNYTLFGKVVSGIENIHNIQIGDRILDMILIK
jgi:cyclophilin family peptidyl-prolyl cis-trans isomerase/HEAT repeat protein